MENIGLLLYLISKKSLRSKCCSTSSHSWTEFILNVVIHFLFFVIIVFLFFAGTSNFLENYIMVFAPSLLSYPALFQIPSRHKLNFLIKMSYPVFFMNTKGSGQEMHNILWKNSILKADASMTFTACCQLCHCKQQFQRGIQKKTAKQLITRCKNFRIWRRNLRSLRVASRKKMPSGSIETLGKSSVDKSVGNVLMKHVWEGLHNCRVTLIRLCLEQRLKKESTKGCILLQKKHSSQRREEWKKNKQKPGRDTVKEQRKILRECSLQSVTHHRMVHHRMVMW